MYGNKFSDQLLPLITPEMLVHFPDQTCDILNKLIRLAQQSNTSTGTSGGEGNLENIVQTTTSYADGGVNVVTAYLSDGTTQDFQIRNGHQGSQGDPGPSGQDATIAVGTTTTLPAGSSATVTDVGTPSAAVLNFGIPKGDTGAPGQDGTSATVAVGTTTTLAPGSSATVTNSGTTSAAVFNFGIPEGTPGAAATITAGNTTTLSPGSSATVTNSGTSSAAVFDFGIPQGATGATGPGVASGGTAGQVLTKNSSTDYDTSWTTPTTYSDFVGATSVLAGTHGLVPAPTTSDPDKFLKGDGTWGTPPGTTYTAGNGIDITGSTIAVDTSIVATLSDIPTVNDATLTIQKNGTNVSTFTANASSNVTANITVPTNTSDLNNDSGFLTSIPIASANDLGGIKVGTNLSIDANGVLSASGGGKSCPIGTILPYSASVLPDGYLECDGSAVSRTTYAELFAVIGTTYGAGDGSTTFNLPNLKGKVAVGQDANDTSFDTLGETGGNKTVDLSHSHTVNSHNHSLPANTGAHTLTTSEIPSHNHGDLNWVDDSYHCSLDAGSSGDGIKLSYTNSYIRYNQGDFRTGYTGGGGSHTHPLGGNTGDAAPGTDSQLSNAQSVVQPYMTVKYIIKYAEDSVTTANVLNSYSTSSSDVYSASYINGITPQLPNNIAYVGSELAVGGTSQIQTTDIADGAVTSAKIDWSTISTYAATLTSDSNGYIEIPDSVVNPTNGFILAIALTGAPGDNRKGLLTWNYCNRDNAYPNGVYTYKCMHWDQSVHASTTIPIKIWYVRTS